jgi:hypothetical protein
MSKLREKLSAWFPESMAGVSMAERMLSRMRQLQKGLALTAPLAMLPAQSRQRGPIPCWDIQSKLGVVHFQPGKYHLPLTQNNWQ